MNKDVVFPKDEELEYLVLKKISHNPKLSKETAEKLVKEELLRVVPESLTTQP